MSTPALTTLDQAGVEYWLHTYDVSDRVGHGYGPAVAAAIGVTADRVFKTLLAVVDDEPVVAIVPVDGRLSTKALARLAGGKKASMAAPADAERLTGYVTGGISPLG
ncbi:MAG: YbaK/EbsC family protein, partial [Acidimicrobiia bacterium]